ncbi:hypothetical protein Tco_0551026 [Tanacetum coccineum]
MSGDHGESSKTKEDETYERVYDVVPKDKNSKGDDTNVHYWYIRRPLVKLKFYMKRGKLVGVQGLKATRNEKNTYVTEIVGKSHGSNNQPYDLIEVDLRDVVTNFSVSYFEDGHNLGMMAKLSIETTKKTYVIGDSGSHRVFERNTNVPEGTFDGIFGYNKGGREGQIRTIGFFKDTTEIL